MAASHDDFCIGFQRTFQNVVIIRVSAILNVLMGLNAISE
jgi:hypothetical protein